MQDFASCACILLTSFVRSRFLVQNPVQNRRFSDFFFYIWGWKLLVRKAVQLRQSMPSIGGISCVSPMQLSRCCSNCITRAQTSSSRPSIVCIFCSLPVRDALILRLRVSRMGECRASARHPHSDSVLSLISAKVRSKSSCVSHYNPKNEGRGSWNTNVWWSSTGIAPRKSTPAEGGRKQYNHRWILRFYLY